ncbi:folylpolyglutamate synthase, putative [Theileria equi strain WA]|uniref:Folylpolyglutamate synthase, putative n=1 Tax=Theileria equi strain WA TaxID=1537102 RepID=L0AXY2_THEEQ|nr:folylpolyglutamate synthase, putative [Theileria equi strain WA]AFZ80128.1 folylpolyglutamate synthase, putative [Theileria equi strain WA]|eukprot:XP_004829794.1 folylpolyglutamate synthase, putative [Theileria equi strain WA]
MMTIDKHHYGLLFFLIHPLPLSNLFNHVKRSFILLMALLYFEEKGTEWIILETGIGGLLDKTNFATNTKIVVISSIGYDHMHILGKRLEDIAKQKAGTIKQNSIVVLGPNCYDNDIFVEKANAVNARVIKCEKRVFSSFDEENSETARVVFEQALELGKAPRSALTSCLAMRMQMLSSKQIESVKAHLSSLIGECSNAEKVGTPRAVIFDIGHNETAINRLCNDIVKSFEDKIILCVSISHNRSLGIFNPAASVRNRSGELILKDIYFVPSGHDYCRQLSDADQESLTKSVSPELETAFKRGIEKSKGFCSTCESLDPFDAILYNAFLESCRGSHILVITGTAYIMEQAWKSLGLSL